ncbi:MAG: Rieske (2Fe-2S) protein [Rhodospirillales bacterium]|nr:Rieske (2Fe-2S) protein [Rhodospirillales bacterium]
MSGALLCAVDDVPEDGSQAFIAELGERQVAVMVIRKGDGVFVYENSCPHIGAPLDFISGQFLNHERTHIMCSTHAALFQIEDGFCISGPCEGDHLIQINADVRGGNVYVSL